MVIRQGTFHFGEHRFDANAYHVHITTSKGVKIDFTPDKEWLTPRHELITMALDDLEKALQAVIS